MENKHTRSVSLIDGHTEEMTNAEVIKALECHIKRHCWDDCPNAREEIQLLDKACSQKIAEDALDLIKRQQDKIERLKNLIESVTEGAGKAILAFDKYIAIAKSEAIKEFAERFKDKYKKPFFYLGSYEQFMQEVDDLVKEMTEVKNNG